MAWCFPPVPLLHSYVSNTVASRISPRGRGAHRLSGPHTPIRRWHWWCVLFAVCRRIMSRPNPVILRTLLGWQLPDDAEEYGDFVSPPPPGQAAPRPILIPHRRGAAAAARRAGFIVIHKKRSHHKPKEPEEQEPAPVAEVKAPSPSPAKRPRGRPPKHPKPPTPGE